MPGAFFYRLVKCIKIMPDWITQIINALNLSVKSVAVIALFTGVALFSFDTFINEIGLQATKAQLKPYLGAAFLFSIVSIVIHIWLAIGNYKKCEHT